MIVIDSAARTDAELEAAADFRIPACPICDGVLKPDVVFFGESVPQSRVEFAMAKLDQSEALLVAGTSLTGSKIDSCTLDLAVVKLGYATRVKHRNLDVEPALFVAQRFKIFVALQSWFTCAWKQAWSVICRLRLASNSPIADFAWKRDGRVAN